MTEPTNPLFEDEKEFLERKKLEYERALRGDVEEIKETTVQAGKVALIGAGVVGGIWLITKAFGGKSKKRKHKHKKHRPEFEDYAGFDSFDENDQEWSELADDFQAPDYAYDPDNSGSTGDGFYFEAPAGFDKQEDEDEDDDNGFGDYPDFPAHSTSHHGEDTGSYQFDDENGDDSFDSDSSAHDLPYDDSRRLPHSNSFADVDLEEEPVADAPAKSKSKGSTLLPMLVSFAQSETGRVIVAQAAAVALALVTKTVQGFTTKDEAETGKNADLAGSSASAGVQPATWPATSAAQDASAAAHHDDTLIPREPLA